MTHTSADRREAERFIREAYDDNPRVCRTWLANRRDSLFADALQIVKQKREHLEWKARHREAVDVLEAAE